MAGMGVAEAGAGLVAALHAACQPATPEGEAVAALREYGCLLHQLEYQCVRLVALLARRGTFPELGYQRVGDALADLLGWDRAVAYRRARLAAEVSAQTSATGEPLPPQLPATAAAFAAGQLDLARVEVICAAMRSGPATHISPDDWRVAEQQLASYAADGARPADLKAFAHQLLGLLDQDGPDPDTPDPGPRGVPRLTPRPEGGGLLRGELDPPGMPRWPPHSTPCPSRSRRGGWDWRNAKPRRSSSCAGSRWITEICPRPVGNAPTSTSPFRLPSSKPGRGARCWTTAAASPRPNCACWPATRR